MTTVTGPALALLREWLPSNDAAERPQIQVATVDEDGRPDIRTVLLSEWDEHGFVFHTDATSRKAEQLERYPAVALEVLWPGFSRRLAVRGTAEPQDRAGLDRAYAARSPYLRQLAWQNTDAMAQEALQSRRARWSDFTAGRDATSVRAPSTWTGFVVRPERITFWLPDPIGPSHRVEYSVVNFAADDAVWTERHLPG